MKKHLAFFCCILFHSLWLDGQTNLHDFGFYYNDSIEVDYNSQNLNYPWIGGLNFCHFSLVDLNFDGKKDLFAFDRSGNRKLVFKNNGISNQFSFDFDKLLPNKLPLLKEWAIFIDYNGDNAEDIFTYTTGGIAVYKNISTLSTGIKFELVTHPFIYSMHGQVYTNLYVTPVDYPAISDLDNDGDLDILTFWGLGLYLQYHKNLSMELFGHADSLKYELQTYCWGNFEESEDYNAIVLNIECPFDCNKYSVLDTSQRPKDRHTGSTMLALDLDDDQDKDLLLGDIDYPSLFKLTNGGTPSNANIIQLDTFFPNMNPIHLFSFPVPSYLDIDNDGINELILSPFDEKTYHPVSDNTKSIWLYENTGSNSAPDFTLSTKEFIQNQTIDVGAGAFPITLDYNNDGLEDIVIANFGKRDSSYYQNYTLYSTYISQLVLLENTGTTQNPKFEIVDTNFANLRQYQLESIYPTFGDIDNDSDIDMLLGSESGDILFFENQSNQMNQYNFTAPIANYMSIDVGNYSTPQLFDLNKDGLLDLIIGNKMGVLYYFQNSGTLTNPNFELISEQLGNVNVNNPYQSNYGYAAPCFFTVNEETRLFVGSESGAIYYYKNIDNNITGDFQLFDEHLLYIDEGFRTGVCVHNFNNDLYIDMIIGNYAGGLAYYQGCYPPDMITKEIQPKKTSVELYPNPGKERITVKTSAIIKDIEIYNTLNQPIQKVHHVIQKTYILNIENLARGVYFIKLTLADSNHHEDIQIERFIKL